MLQSDSFSELTADRWHMKSKHIVAADDLSRGSPIISAILCYFLGTMAQGPL